MAVVVKVLKKSIRFYLERLVFLRLIKFASPQRY